LGLDESDVVADIGCGVGYFSIPAVEIIKNSNKVYALDTSGEMLLEVEKRASIADCFYGVVGELNASHLFTGELK
jgi:ubiquinone/menaquinone biosynthesis C-methylase UbiE